MSLKGLHQQGTSNTKREYRICGCVGCAHCAGCVRTYLEILSEANIAKLSHKNTKPAPLTSAICIFRVSKYTVSFRYQEELALC